MNIKVGMQFELVNRDNCHAKYGNEWALNAQIVDCGWWTITTWDKKPSCEEVDRSVETCKRAISVWRTRSRVAEVVEVLEVRNT